MHIIVESACSWGKIEMGVQRLSIWVVPRLTYSMNVKNMALRNDDVMMMMMMMMIRCVVPLSPMIAVLWNDLVEGNGDLLYCSGEIRKVEFRNQLSVREDESIS